MNYKILFKLLLNNIMIQILKQLNKDYMICFNNIVKDNKIIKQK